MKKLISVIFLEPPFICLVVSGGHTHLVCVKDYGKYDWTMFDPEAKKARHEEVFPKELEKAFSAPFVCDERYQAFCEKFTYLDDADAAKRVVEAIIAPQEQAAPQPARLVRYRKRQRVIGKLRSWKNKLKNGILKRLRYANYLNKPLQENSILLEAQQGKSMDGNVYALLCELAKGTEYQDYRLYLTCLKDNRKRFERQLKNAQNWCDRMNTYFYRFTLVPDQNGRTIYD